MKVLLTIWISVVLIQEVVPSTLVRLPRSSPTSSVHTEYEAKYEQKGRHGNESVSSVSGKQQILHDNCSENWNAFADKCASLIKDLVASLANAVHSKPGDATKMQLQIKNTFSHLDQTHNCTCLNHTEQALSDLDLSPLINNITINTVAPALTRNVNGDGQENKQCGLNGGSCDEHNDHGEIPVFVTPVPHLKRMSNGLADIENNAMNPSNPENSNDGLTSNSRRQVNYPQVSRQPDNKVSPLFIVTPRPIYPAKSLQTPVIAADASPATEKTVPVILTTNRNDIPTSATQAASPISRNNKGIPPGVVTEPHLSPNNIARRLITSPVVVPGKNYGVPDQPSQTSESNVVFPVQPAVPLPLTQKRASQPSLVAPIGQETSNVEPSGHASEPSLVVPTQTHASSPMIPIINSNSNLPESPEFNEETLKPTPINPNPQSKVLVTNNQPAVSSLKRPEGIIPVTHIPVYPVDPVAIAPVTQNLPNSQNVNSPKGNALALGQPGQFIGAGEPGTSQENCEDSNTNNNKTPVLPVAAVAPLTPVLPAGKQNTEAEPGTIHGQENCEDSNKNLPVVAAAPVSPLDPVTNNGNSPSTSVTPALIAPIDPITNNKKAPLTGAIPADSVINNGNGPLASAIPVPLVTPLHPTLNNGNAHLASAVPIAPIPAAAPVTPIKVPEADQLILGNPGDENCGDCSNNGNKSPINSVVPIVPVDPIISDKKAPLSSVVPVDSVIKNGHGPLASAIPVAPIPAFAPVAAIKVPKADQLNLGNPGDENCDDSSNNGNKSPINSVVPIVPVDPIISDKKAPLSSVVPVDSVIKNGHGPLASAIPVAPIPAVAPVAPVHPMTGATTPAYVVPVNPLPIASQVTEPQNGESGFPNGVGLTAPIPVYPQTNLPTALTPGSSENCAEDSSNGATQQQQPSVIPINDSGVPEKSPEKDNTPVAQVITPNELQPEVTPTGGEQSGLLSQHGQRPTVLLPVKPVALLPNGAQQSGHGAPSSSLIPAKMGAQPTALITNKYPESQPIPAVQPAVVVPNGAHQENIEDPVLLRPTTHQTTSVEPTPPLPPIFLSPTESTKPLPQTSLPQTLLTNPSSSPKTSLPHDDDDDDDEDCCSCESCTEEEITDPKAYKESACKNLEEARRELKLIFEKIKKNLRCGRKAPQITTTAATTTQLHTPFSSSSSPVV